MRAARLAWVLALFSISLGCSEDDPTRSDDEVGDGDGDAGDGDEDGEPGDGDGDELPSLPPGFLDELTNAGGCGDVYIGVSNEAGTMALLFNGAELAAQWPARSPSYDPKFPWPSTTGYRSPSCA